MQIFLGKKMADHTHHHVETYEGLVGMGFDRKTDENTIIYYLQKFSDDALMKALTARLSDEEMEEIFLLLTRLLKKYLSDSEYHRLFLKDNHP
jgi:TorA maturation chaperone TorD